MSGQRMGPVHVKTPTLFVTEVAPGPLRALLHTRDFTATVFTPTQWSESILGEKLFLGKEVGSVVIYTKTSGEEVWRMLRAMAAACKLFEIPIFWIVPYGWNKMEGEAENMVRVEEPSKNWVHLLDALTDSGFHLVKKSKGEDINRKRIIKEKPNEGIKIIKVSPNLGFGPLGRQLGPSDFGKEKQGPSDFGKEKQNEGNKMVNILRNSGPVRENEAQSGFGRQSGNSFEVLSEFSDFRCEPSPEPESDGKPINKEIILYKVEKICDGTEFFGKHLDQIQIEKSVEESWAIEMNKLKHELSGEKRLRILVSEYNRLKQYLVIKFEEKNFKTEFIVFGSVLSSLFTASSDMDIAIRSKDIRKVNEFLALVRSELRSYYGIKNIRKANIRYGARIPILDMDVLINNTAVQMQFSVNNFNGIMSGLWIALLVDIYPSLKDLWVVIKVWTDKYGIRNSIGGTLSSYGFMVLLIFYLQSIRILPMIFVFVKSKTMRYDDDELKIKLRRFLDKNFNPLHIGLVKILCGFFKFGAEFDFENLRISLHDGIFLRNQIKDSKPMEIEEPFERIFNIANSVTAEGYGKIKGAFSETWKLLDGGVKGQSEFLKLIGLNVSLGIELQEKLNIDLDDEEPVEVTKDELARLEKELDEEPEDKEQQQEPADKERLQEPADKEQQQENAAQENDSGVYDLKIKKKIGLISPGLITIFFIISLFFPFGMTAPMVCHRSASSNVIHFKANEFSCGRIIDFLGKNVSNENIEIFRPNVKAFSFVAWRCMIVSQSVDYRTDILGYRHKRPPEQRIIKVPSSECKNWISFKHCDFGPLIKGNDKDYHTGHNLDLEFSWWKIGWQKARTDNCFLTEETLVGEPGKEKIRAVMDEVEHCEFKLGECNLRNGASLIWKVENDVSNQYDSRTCTYENVGLFEGNFSKGIWYSQDLQRSLIFDKNTVEVKSCGMKLRVSNSGLAIRQHDYEIIMNGQKAARKRRFTKFDVTDDTVTTSELLSRLQAEAVYQDKQIRIAIENIVKLLCESIKEEQIVKDLRHLDPTLFVREKFKNEFLEGIWLGPNTLEYWPCVAVNFTLAPTKDGRCFEQLPINISIDNNWERAFLDQRTNIVSSISKEGDCNKLRYFSMKKGGKVIKIDQWTGEIMEVMVKETKIDYVDNEKFGKIQELSVHVFAKDSLNNLSQHQIDYLGLVHDSFGRKGLDSKAIERRESIWGHSDGIGWSMDKIWVTLDFWEIFERITCIWIVMLTFYKIWVWKNKKIIRHIVRNKNLGQQFGSDLAPKTNFEILKGSVVDEGSIEMCGDMSEDRPQRKRRNRRRI